MLVYKIFQTNLNSSTFRETRLSNPNSATHLCVRSIECCFEVEGNKFVLTDVESSYVKAPGNLILRPFDPDISVLN